MQLRAKRIEISGGIATGKTTLAQLLAGEKRRLVLEEFRGNPFWKRFYDQPHLFAFEKDVTFLAQHTGEIKAAGDSSLVVCDYAVFQDLAYASLYAKEHLAVMQSLYRHLYRELPCPAVVVHLVCDVNTQLDRIRARGRAEERSITRDYLEALNNSIEQVLTTMFPETGVRIVRSDLIDFRDDLTEAIMLRDDLLQWIAEPPSP
jgi:deoxyguanosine kinase